MQSDNRLRRFLAPLFLLACSAVVGCGGVAMVKPKGKVVQNGQNLTVGEKTGMIQVTLFAESDTEMANAQATNTKSDGTFEVVGREGKGVAKGKYKVAVQVLDPYPKTDKLKGKYDRDKTTLTVDVSDAELIVDVGK